MLTCPFINFYKFSGKQSENFAKFRKAVQRNFEFLEWNAKKRAQFLPTLLTNKALRVYETLAPNVTTDIDAVWRALEKHFSQKRKGVLHVHALIDRQQLKSESVENYANAMNEYFDRYEITDEFVRMTYFVKGLRSDIKTQLLKQRPNTLNECEEYAQIIESADQQSSSLADAVPKLSFPSELGRDTAKNQSDNPFCRFCGAKHKFGQHLRSFQRPQNRFRGGNTMPTQGARFPYRPRYSGSLSHGPHATFQPNTSTATGPRPIYQGIGSGISRQNPHSTPPTRCFQCGNSGHLARQCTRSYRHIPNNDRRIARLDPRNVSYNYTETTRQSNPQSQTLLTCRVPLSSKSMVTLNLPLNDKDIITCSALVDTGSHVNMVSVSQFKSLKRLGAIDVENVEAEAEELIGLGDNGVPVQHCCYLKLNFGINQPFIRTKFHVIHEKNLDLVLGRQFLAQTNASLNFQ